MTGSPSAGGCRHPEVAVGAVCRHEGRLLVVRRAQPPAQGSWTVPGGRVERGETLAAAVERELAEETGLRGRCGPLLGWVERIDEAHHFVILDFAVEVDDPTPARAGSDAAELAWVTPEELASLPLVPGLLAFLRQAGVLPGGGGAEAGT